MSDLQKRLQNLVTQTQSYHNQAWQSQARKIALTSEIEEELEINATIEVSSNPDLDLRDALAIQLMDWFKNKFFKWFKAPENSQPLPGGFDRMTGDRIENYRLPNGSTYSFQRFNNPLDLIKPENRQGRCGEWANAFCFLATVMGFEARYICALYEDHVWVEIFSQKLDRWVHFDPCENSYDKPLLYELGWKKKLSFVVAAQYDLITDVSRKYSIDHEKLVLNQYSSPVTPEQMKEATKNINILLKNKLNLPASRVNELKRRRKIELAAFEVTGKLDKSQLSRGNFTGRQNADSEWIKARGEGGNISGPEVVKKSDSNIMEIENSFKYFASKDEIVIDDKKFNNLLTNAAYINLNMFKKTETDWNKTYICRKEFTDFGYFSLKFKSKPIKSIKFNKLDQRTYNSGQSLAVLATKHEVYQLKTLENIGQDNEKESDHVCLEINFEKPIETFTIHFRSFDSNLDRENNIQWQHSQFFRDSCDSLKCNFEFTVES